MEAGDHVHDIRLELNKGRLVDEHDENRLASPDVLPRRKAETFAQLDAHVVQVRDVDTDLGCRHIREKQEELRLVESQGKAGKLLTNTCQELLLLPDRIGLLIG
ncbi:MAG: hypothetical protein CM1200mP2_38040 [Planctomycetaceae bacterium]|nr:MAG: hypothetical protein CM1200mP2_38040 [Planctomycetaceae bacterium]